MKGTLRVMLFFCLLSFFAISTNLHAESQKSVSASPPEWALRNRPVNAPLHISAFDKLHSDLQQTGFVRVIVRFRDAVDMPQGFQAEGKMSEKEIEKQRKAIEKNQGILEGRLSANGKTKTKKFGFIPFMALEIDAADFQMLLDSPEVDLIEEDIPVPPVLSESIPLMGGDVNGAFSGYNGAGQTVAILDTGVATGHPVFSGKIVSEACYSTTVSGQSTSVCPNGQNSQTGAGSGLNCGASIANCDHGTHVAAIAAGSTGVAKSANIIAIQVFANFSNSVMSWGSDQILGLERVYALRSTYSIASVNMSMGVGGPYSSNCDASNAAFKAAVDNLRSVNIATVIASGNNSFTTGISSPGCVSTAISVGSTTKQDAVASYSNSSSLVKLLAPGSSIYAAVPGNTYEYKSGTSMATPHVAGAWAVVKSRNPAATVDDVLAALTSTGASVTDSRNGVTKQRIRLDAATAQIPVEPRLQFTSATYAVNENAGTAIITVRRDISSSGAVTVDWATSNGTATAGDDYTAASGTISFAAGESGDKTFSLSVIDDSIPEAPETIYLTLSNPTGGAMLGSVMTASLTIDDTTDLVDDANPDIFWRNPSTGQNLLWYMSDGIKLGPAITFTTLDPLWEVTSVTDFDKDGKKDILWRNSTTGQNMIWLMNGATKIGQNIALPTVAVPWKTVSIGDYDGDGNVDILWRNSSTGQNLLWIMNGTAKVGPALTVTTVLPPWAVASGRDFNNDGKSDILWRNPATGENVLWFMNGVTKLGSKIDLPIVPEPWRIVAVEDFSADNKVDILWRNFSNGQNLLWFMDTGVKQGPAATVITVPLPWEFVTAKDINADGKADIMWRNPTTGENVFWHMDGPTKIGPKLDLPNVFAPWKVVGMMK